jgi:hypothetical protein
MFLIASLSEALRGVVFCFPIQKINHNEKMLFFLCITTTVMIDQNQPGENDH